MTYPNYPTHVRGKYKYGELDQPTQAWKFLRGDGTHIGYIFDDTTPNLKTHWLPNAIGVARAENRIVVVLVAPGNAGYHHKGCVNFLEVYWKCTGPTLRQYMRFICKRKKNRYAGYVMQKEYGLQDAGAHGRECVPTPRQYRMLRNALRLLRPKYGLWDF